jgi:hypothetical protein
MRVSFEKSYLFGESGMSRFRIWSLTRHESWSAASSGLYPSDNAVGEA